MSKLYLSEEGLVIPTLCEELTQNRRARKHLALPATRMPARLFLLAYAYPSTDCPLRVAVNGTEIQPVPSSGQSVFYWYEVQIPPHLLNEGDNCFEFWTDSVAMNSWSLALEPGHTQPRSLVTNDGGLTWRDHHMGYHNATRGEYVVRVRLEEDQDPPPPAWVPEDLSSPCVQDLLGQLPFEVWKDQPLLSRVRALSTWISTSWEYRSSARAAQYAPWDINTILAWGKAKRGHNGQVPIVMCVHYGVAFVSACQALGIPARAAIFTEDIAGFNGHFTAEVWFPEYHKWVYVDPNMDLLFFKDGVPLSVPEIRSLAPDLSPYFVYGPGLEVQLPNPEIKPFVDHYPQASFMKHRSLWWRSDFLSKPFYSPPGHGSTCYCETGLVWESKDLQDGLAMFPYFGNEEYFNAPPG